MKTFTITRTVNAYKFAELSGKAQEKVRTTLAEAMDGAWYENTQEDFHQILTYLKFDNFDSRFSGFYSQGDGASFTGFFNLEVAGTCLENILAYSPMDEELKDIATELDIICARLQIETNGVALDDPHVHITRFSSRYSHENTMEADCDTEIPTLMFEGEHKEVWLLVLNQAKRLARWYYASLQQEYEYLLSDERISEDNLWYDEYGNELVIT